MTCQHCGQPIVQRLRRPGRWVHLSSPTSHGNYVMCMNQDGYPPVRRATPTPDHHPQEGDPHGR